VKQRPPAVPKASASAVPPKAAPTPMPKTACDSGVHAAKGNNAYSSRTPTLCEGLYIRSATDTHIQLLALTRGATPNLIRENDAIVAKWSAHVAGSGTDLVRIRASADHQGKSFQMDGIARLGDERFVWPSQKLTAAGIPAAAANVRVTTAGDATGAVYIPVLTGPPLKTDVYRLSIHTESSIKKLRFAIDEDGPKTEAVAVRGPKMVAADGTFTVEFNASELSGAERHRLTLRASTSAGEQPLVLVVRFFHHAAAQ
jgi:hypothetical protein